MVLLHTAEAGPSAFLDVLGGRMHLAPWRSVDVPSGEELPADLDDIAGLLVLGGTTSAVDPGVHDWMSPELALLERAVGTGVPVLGIGLGAQLLGQALGGRVSARDAPEIAFVPLRRTDQGRQDPVMAGWSDGAAALFLHEDEVESLPPDAALLLTGSDGNAAWRQGSALATQFHPEVDADQLAMWVERGLVSDLLDRAGVDAGALVDEARRRDRFVVALGRALVGRWIDGPVRERVA